MKNKYEVGELMERIVFFDGICNLCNNSVQFIIKRDPAGLFKFASLQSEIGQKFLHSYDLPKEINSFVLIENGKVYIKSTAALRVCSHLKGFWKLFACFQIIPPFIRDAIYEFIANRRYKWFGQRDHCMLPQPEWKNRFLD
jgi:predicted DCC family thiol-disulfide oxidoreductase YuxK